MTIIRENELQAWVQHYLQANPQDFECEGKLELTALSGDAGFRRYYRPNIKPAVLAVDAPPATEDTSAFVDIAHFLRRNGVHTPAIVAADPEQGFLLIEDLGETLYLPELLADGPETLYSEAMMILLHMQQATAEAECPLPSYDRARLLEETAVFPEWFAGKLLGRPLNDEERARFDKLAERLADLALEQPQVFVHRDFHSRNLIVMNGFAPGVIDFQDAVWGPITYDLVSLYRDCYVRWQPDQVRRWALAYGNLAVETGLMTPVGESRFMQWFDWMGVQRHLKVLGVFSRLSLRDGKDAYLKDIPLVIRYLLEVCEAYPELQEFADWFKRTMVPGLDAFDWYSDYRQAGDRQS